MAAGAANTTEGLSSRAEGSNGQVTISYVLAAPSISGMPPGGTVGASYSFAYSVSGAPTPTTTVTDGVLPPGLVFSAGGVLSGIPTTAGTFSFTVTATNAVGSDSTVSSVTINPASVAPGQPTITSVTPADGQATVTFTPGTAGVPATTSYTVTATPTSGPAVTSPAASGSPVTVAGLTNGTAYRFTVAATNATGTTTSDPYGPVTVGVAPTITGTPPNGQVGTGYTYTYTLSGKPAPSTTVTAGTLPPGLTLSTSGVLSGTPTTAGTSGFTVTATNPIGSDSTVSSVTVSPAAAVPVPPGKPTITSVTAGDGQATVAFTPGTAGVPAATSYTVTATPTSGPAVTSSAASGSPVTVTGLTNGVAYRFTVAATNATGTTTSDPYGPVTIGVAPTITGTPPAGQVGTAYTYTYTLTGKPAPTPTVTSGALPPGLTLSMAGVLSGTPTAAGTYGFTVTATNAVGSKSTTSSVTVSPAAARSQTITFTSPGPTGAPAGTSYTVKATASSGLPVQFTRDGSSTAGACTVTSNGDSTGTVSLTGPGTCRIDADQPGNATYSPAPQVTQTVTVTAAPAAAPTVDTSAAGYQAKLTTSVSTSTTLTTTGTNELLVAYVAVDGGSSPTQKVTSVTGGGLTWTLAARSNGAYGTAEVWQAYATSRFSGTVTATYGGNYTAALAVAAYKGAARTVGNTNTTSGTSTMSSATVTTSKANSLVWAAGHNWSAATTPVPADGQTLVYTRSETNVGDAYWAQSVPATTAAGTKVTITDGLPKNSRWQMAAVEITTP